MENLLFIGVPIFKDIMVLELSCKWNSWFYNAVIGPKDADKMANSVDSDQTAVYSGSALFVQTYLSQYFSQYPKNSPSVIFHRHNFMFMLTLEAPVTTAADDI